MCSYDSSALSGAAPGATVFETGRLRGRRWVAHDLAALLAVYGDADAMRWVGDGRPLSADDAARWIEVTERNYAQRGYGMFALEDRASGDVVGFAGIVHPGGQPEAEVKYALARAHWGRGLATEAVRALLHCAWHDFALRSVIATVSPQNLVSQRVLLASGMRLLHERTHDDGSRTLVFGCSAP